MPSPNATPTPITPPRVPLIDPRTGLIDRAWYMFFISIFNAATAVVDDVVGPNAESLIASYDAALRALADEVGTQPTSQSGVLEGQIVELQKRIDALESAASAPQLGTMAPMNKDFMDFIGFNQNAGITVQPGQIAWNSGDGCLDIGMGYDSVVLQTGMEMVYRIKASAAISNGELVMFDGSVGASGVLKGKPSTTGLTEGQYIMGVATMDIANNGFGYVTAFGLVRGINTTGSSVGETWADGDILYYNTAYVGGLTKVLPTTGAVVIVASVVNAGSGGSGSLFIRPTFMPRLAQLTGVYAPSPSNGDKLIYNSSTGRWEQNSISYLVLE